uniref:Clathrin light chain n=1 Tax=Ditylenchus dipsaci TaxID=166011 RepID=A0A915E0H8_9BILA
MQSTRADLADWKPPSDSQFAAQEQESSPEPTIEQKESVKHIEQTEKFADFSKEELKEESPAPTPNNWAGFGDDSGPVLPSSDSDFFQKALAERVKATANLDGFDRDETMIGDAFRNAAAVDPFAPISEPSLINEVRNFLG